MSDFVSEILISALPGLIVQNIPAEKVLHKDHLKLLAGECINTQVLGQCFDAFLSESDFYSNNTSINSGHEFSELLSGLLMNRADSLSRFYDGNTVSDISISGILNNHQFFQSYSRLISSHRLDLERSIRCGASVECPVVIFTAKKVFFNQLRLSKVLRDIGYKTIAIVFDTQMTQHQAGFFDEVIYTDLLSFLLCINKVDINLLLHTQGWLFRYHIPVLIDAYKSPSCKQIIEMMDCQSFYLPESVIQSIPESMKKAWGVNAIENHQLQLACEDYIIHHSDGVIFNGDDTYREPLVKSDSENLRNKHLSFSALPLKDFFYVSNQVNKYKKLVFVGGIPPLLPSRPYELFGDSQLIGLVKRMIENGCHLDIYNNPLLAAEDDYKALYPDFVELAASHDNFNFFLGDMPQYITEKISKYDIGLMVYDFCGTYAGELHFKHLIPTKLFSYLEAGLPVLVSDRFTAVCDIVREYRIGVVISQREIDAIPEIIDMIDIVELKRNVLIAREELQMHNNIHRLTGFYEQVMA